MPDLEYFVVAEAHSVDFDTGAMTMFRVLDDLAAPSVPYTIPRASLICCWLSSKEEVELRREWQVKFIFSGVVREEKTFRLNFTSEARFQYLTAQVGNIPVAKIGDVFVDVLINDKQVERHTIEVSERQVKTAER